MCAAVSSSLGDVLRPVNAVISRNGKRVVFNGNSLPPCPLVGTRGHKRNRQGISLYSESYYYVNSMRFRVRGMHFSITTAAEPPRAQVKHALTSAEKIELRMTSHEVRCGGTADRRRWDDGSQSQTPIRVQLSHRGVSQRVEGVTKFFFWCSNLGLSGVSTWGSDSAKPCDSSCEFACAASRAP